jgi:hypothetical protein
LYRSLLNCVGSEATKVQVLMSIILSGGDFNEGVWRDAVFKVHG